MTHIERELTLSHRDDAYAQNDELIFEAEELDIIQEETAHAPWKILLVDDESEVHDVTKLALKRFVFDRRNLLFLSAYSGSEAKQMIEAHPDTAIILLDVVMETKDAGLQVARHIRTVLGNELVQIILRTGQPGEAPEESVILNYEINDYKTKTELTRKRLMTSITSALRSYRHLQTIEAQRQQMKSLYTDLQQQNIQLQEAKESAEKANRTKSEFLSTMNHELRTPLTVMMAKTQLMLRGVHGPITEKQIDSLNTIQRNGHKLLSMFANILDLVDIEIGNLALNIDSTSIRSAYEASLKTIMPLVQEKEIQVDYQTSDEDLTVQADEYRFIQILTNLLQNAVKFTPPGGKIGLDVMENKRQDRIELRIWDTGIGIAQQDMACLFKPFTQLDSGIRRRYDGNGLGLSITSGLVALHKGYISVQSEVSKGSSFTIHLPRS